MTALSEGAESLAVMVSRILRVHISCHVTNVVADTRAVPKQVADDHVTATAGDFYGYRTGVRAVVTNEAVGDAAVDDILQQ